MRSVSVRLCDLGKIVVHIGFVGENNYRSVNIDCKKVFDKIPDAIPSLSVKAPDETTYPATVTRDGDIVTWTVTDSDLVYDGSGEIQLTFTDTEGNIVAKSDIAKTRIHPSVGADGVAPTPIQNWIDQANEILEGIPGEISDEIAEQLPGEVAEQLPGAVADLIDDTATYGDTDKAWSADKLEKSFRDAKKNPEFTGGIVFGHGNVAEGNSIPVSAWTKNTAYVVGNLCSVDITPRPNPSGENMFDIYRCKTAHTSGNSFDASKWDLILMQSTEESSASLPYKEYAEVVGNGWPNGLQSNARRLDWDGNEELAGDLTVFAGTNDEVSVSELKNEISKISTFITPQMYGAKGDNSTDDTQAFQAAINAAISTHKCLVVPIGSYKITDSLTVDGNFSMRGTNNCKNFGSFGEFSTIRCSANSLFTTESGLRNVNIEGIVFYGNQANTLFDIGLDTSNISNCTIWNFDTVFKKKVGTCHIHDNSFISICGYFTYGQVVDSYITNNYINGENGHNAICFLCGNVTSTSIIGNYFDYFKYGFYGPTTGQNYFQECNIIGNIFDIIWRVFNTAMRHVNISSNTFTNISATWFVNDSTQTSKMYAADAEMLAYRPCAIYVGRGVVLTESTYGMFVDDLHTGGYGDIYNMNIVGNNFRCSTALYICALINNTFISDNLYSNGKLLQLVDNGGDSEHLINTFEQGNGNIVWVGQNTISFTAEEQKISFIDAIYRIEVDDIQRMIRNNKIKTIIDNGCNVFKGAEVIHNGIVYRAEYNRTNDSTTTEKRNVIWKDSMGRAEGELTTRYTYDGDPAVIEANVEELISGMIIPFESSNGTTGLTIWHSGRNLFSFNRTQGTLTGYESSRKRTFEMDKYYLGLAQSNHYDPSQITSCTVDSSNGTITLNTKTTGYGAAFPVPVKGGEKFYFRYEVADDDTSTYFRYNFYQEDGTYIENGSNKPSNRVGQKEVTVPANAAIMCLIFETANNTERVYSNVCVNVSDSEFNGQYVAHESLNKSSVTWDDSVTKGSFNAITGALTEITPTSKTVQLTPVSITTLSGINTIFTDIGKDMKIKYLSKPCG